MKRAIAAAVASMSPNGTLGCRAVDFAGDRGIEDHNRHAGCERLERCQPEPRSSDRNTNTDARAYSSDSDSMFT